MDIIDRPFAGLYVGQDLREMSREELYDALVEALERERLLLERKLMIGRSRR